jgi:hypothetical protein
MDAHSKENLNMTFHRKLRVLAATLAVAAVAAPVASALPLGGTVQIGGELVVPAQLSSWQAHAGQPRSPRLVQVGGALVSPENLSSWQAHARQSDSRRVVQIGGELVKPENLSSWQASQGRSSVSTALPSSDSGFGWHDAGVGFGLALGAMLFVGAAAYVRRTRVTTPC